MNENEKQERQEIIGALDQLEFDTVKFNAWIKQRGFKSEDVRNAVWFVATNHGTIAYFFKMLSGVSRVIGCSYVPRSANEASQIIARGRSVSGKTLSSADLKEIEVDYSFGAIPGRVLFTCSREAGWAPGDVNAETKIVDDLLDGDDSDFEREDLLTRVFDELEIWFQFERPDLFEKSSRFVKVQDIIECVQGSFGNQ